MSYYQQIYDRLRQHGLTEAGALGVIGNFECESNCEPFRVQGDFSSYRSISKGYVKSITEGGLNRDRFSKDGKGFGLAQWTYWTRKAALYDAWKNSNVPIDDVTLQVDFAIHEFEKDFPNDLRILKTTNDMYTACKVVCERFENPAVKNIDARFQAAIKVKHLIFLNQWNKQEQPEQPEKPAEGQPKPAQGQIFWPPRVVDKNCSGWPEVFLLQSLLVCHGFKIGIDGKWSDVLTQAVKDFQKQAKLNPDGVVGKLTWGKLLEVQR